MWSTLLGVERQYFNTAGSASSPTTVTLSHTYTLSCQMLVKSVKPHNRGWGSLGLGCTIGLYIIEISTVHLGMIN